MKKKILKSRFIPLAALICGLTLGSIFITAAFALERRAKAFKVNAGGQTYGTMEGVGPNSPEVPVLIAAIGIDGSKGYIYKADLDKDMPETPEEAQKYMEMLNSRIEEIAKTGEKYVWTIPLYAEDGETVIGEYGIIAPF